MKYILCIIAVVFSLTGHTQQKITIKHTMNGHAYPLQLLELALSKVAVDVDFIEVGNIPTQSRALRLLGKEHGIDVFWGATSSEREKTAKAVLIPIDKGLLGYRIPWVTAKNAHLFKNIAHLGQLKQLSFGLREDWPDTAIFNKNVIKTVVYGKGANPEKMLKSGRFDALAHDIFDTNRHHSEGVINDTYIAIRYPSAVYFFVAKDNITLHQQLSKGLNLAIEDGSLTALFNEFFANDIAKANLSKRRIIEISNPLLPFSAPINNPKYWLTKQQLSKY